MNFGVEHSLYVDYDTHVLLLVILAPPEQTKKMQNLVIDVAKNSFEMVVDDKRPVRACASQASSGDCDILLRLTRLAHDKDLIGNRVPGIMDAGE